MTTKIQQTLFNYGLIASYLLYVLALFGIYKNAFMYLGTLSMILKTYVSLFLIIRFNPYMKHDFTDFDRKIVFSAGTFLFLTTTISSILVSYLKPDIISDLEKKNIIELY
jgi:hypothetical protein